MKKAIIILFLLVSCIHAELQIKTFNGPEAKAYIDDIVNIRIGLFKEYPYLYDGTPDNERVYLETYFSCPEALIILAFDEDNNMVAFSSSIPLKYETDELRVPFKEHGCDINNYLYVGEVMIYPAYRKLGLARSFSQIHEDKARKEGYTFITAMAVERPDNHPCKPADYQSPEPMARYFGYEPVDGLHVHFVWKQIDTHEETKNTLAIWQKRIVP